MKRPLLGVGLIACLALGSLGHAVPARFTFGMKDAAGATYELMVFAPDETQTTIGQDEMYAAYDVGDHKVEGMWQTTLRAHGATQPTPQHICLFHDTNRGEFNLERKMVFVLRGATGQPDILVVEAYLTSNDTDSRLFAITGGKLKPLANIIYCWRAPFRLHGTGAFKFRSSDYDNSVGKWTIRDWTFKPSTWQFACTRKRLVAFDAPNLKTLAR